MLFHPSHGLTIYRVASVPIDISLSLLCLALLHAGLHDDLQKRHHRWCCLAEHSYGQHTHQPHSHRYHISRRLRALDLRFFLVEQLAGPEILTLSTLGFPARAMQYSRERPCLRICERT